MSKQQYCRCKNQHHERRADNFAEQCAIREYEDKVIDFVYNDISGKLGMNRKNEGNDGFCNYKVEGEFTVHFGKSDAQGRGTVGVRWKKQETKDSWDSSIRPAIVLRSQICSR